jgi:hypothetical protein
MEPAGDGREQRSRSGDATPELSRRRWGDDPRTPGSPELEPGGGDLPTNAGTELRLMDADPPVIVSSACPSSRAAQAQLSLAPRRSTRRSQERWPPPKRPRTAMPEPGFLLRLMLTLPDLQDFLRRSHHQASSTLLQEPAIAPASMV